MGHILLGRVGAPELQPVPLARIVQILPPFRFNDQTVPSTARATKFNRYACPLEGPLTYRIDRLRRVSAAPQSPRRSKAAAFVDPHFGRVEHWIVAAPMMIVPQFVRPVSKEGVLDPSIGIRKVREVLASLVPTARPYCST